jgi:hypothetical protein
VMPFFRESRSVLVAVGISVTLGCQQVGVGPCIHTYRDPVLVITAATDSATGRPIAPLFLTRLTVDGQAQVVGHVLTTAFRARSQGDTIVCDVPCGFGTNEGRYGFIASATAYASRPVTVDARFASFDGGCPSFNAGSTEMSVLLVGAR